MGEQKGAKPEAEKKSAADAGAKKDDGKIVAVYKIDMHCEGCAKKIRRSIKHYEGVEDVKTDCGANKLTVIGNVDPTKIGVMLAEKTKKKVELISPKPKKDAAPDAAGGGDKRPDADKKPEEKKEEKKTPKESTVVLKIRTHCDSCIHKMRKIILKVHGVESVNVDGAKDLVTIKGTMDVKDLVSYLKNKLKSNVDVVLPKKDDGGEKKDGGDKKDAGGDTKEKEKEVAATGGEKKEGGATKTEVNKMYHGYGYPPQSIYWSEGRVYGDPSTSYVVEGYQNHLHHEHGYMNQGYMMDPRYPLHAPQIFSDENPNACFVM